MSFSEMDRKKAMAIVKVFETGEPVGDYAAVAVLDDGAGVSYGINQFTHRSGALATVVDKYLASGSGIGRAVLTQDLATLRRRTPAAIKSLAADDAFKKALRAAAITPEMRAAQDETAGEIYLKPALDACAVMGFVLPLSLAVVYDSINHGGWERIRDLAGGIAAAPFVSDEPERQSLSAHHGGKPQEPTEAAEKAWITSYVRTRDGWLASVKRLAATRYRTRFFLNQIAISNWDLRLPVSVQGVRLTDELVINSAVEPSANNPKDMPAETAGRLSESPRLPSNTAVSREKQAASDDPQSEAQPPDHSREKGTRETGEGASESICLNALQKKVENGAAKFDQAESIVESIVVRTDAAKSLWTTVAGTITQTVWAVFGWLAGVPREVWFVVAVVAGCLMLGYLYRQIALGKIREMRGEK